MQPELWPFADKVELRFRGAKGDQFRKGAVITRVRDEALQGVQDGGGCVAVMVELLSYFAVLPSSAPLVMYGTGDGEWRMWTQIFKPPWLCGKL